MGNEQSGKYVVKYPAGFNEKHTEVDNGLSYFKNDLAAAQRSGRAANGIRQRAENRKKLKGFEMDINRMEGMKVDAMADTKAKKYREEDFARWQEMMDGLKALYLECKSLVEGNARTRSAKKDDRATADDFLRGDGAATPAGTDENRSAQLRTGKMSEQEKQAMQEINDKDEVMDDLTDQITENLEFLHMRAEMIGEEIDSQKDLVQEVNSRAVKTKNRTQDLNGDIRRTMEEDGFEQEQQRKKGGGGGNIKTKIAGEMVKGMLK
eukprot:INCI3956.1.p2 GENE.INCI3956.1~~INCI3956.1.p2  ORF type:complete len:265 (+),score=83.90 INCI3956.1:174-968(+)